MERIIETWIGPGSKDGRIEPVSHAENALHTEASKFYGEWWYFDARLDTGHVVVGFLQAAELMSHKPGIELHIYRPSGEKLSVVRKYATSDLRASHEYCDVWVGKNHAYIVDPREMQQPVHRFLIEADGLAADLTFASELPAWRPGGGKTFYGKRGYFSWVVPVPRARVEGLITINGTPMTVKGIGYHDHNVVTADMRHILARWHWGRLYTDDFTLLYAYVITKKRFGRAASKPLMLAYKDTIILSSGEMQVREGDWCYHANADRTYPQELEVSMPGLLSLNFRVREIIDSQDLLTALAPALRNPLLKGAVKKLIGRPGWFRFNSDYVLKVSHAGQTYERRGVTLHEMVALE